MEKHIQYAVQIKQQIVAMFDEDCENFIDIRELQDGDRLKDFIHALSTLVPCGIFTTMVSEADKPEDHLAFNHFVNRLVVEYQGR